MSKNEKVKVKINNEALAKALGVKAGGTVDVECRGGIPTTRYWRNRFQEAELDGSIEVPKSKPKKESAAKPEPSAEKEA